MQKTVFTQKQQMRTSPNHIQAAAILNMNALELEAFIETETIDNPALDVAENSRCPICGFLTTNQICPVCGSSTKDQLSQSLDKSQEQEYLDMTFASTSKDGVFDPFRNIASESSLRDYLKEQARIGLSGRKQKIAEYIIDCLDEDGYFRESLYDIADAFAASVPEIEEILKLVQLFDPPGIAASSLQECLLLQLKIVSSNQSTPPSVEKILTNYWDLFSKKKLKHLAEILKIDLEEVKTSTYFIRKNLTPYPALVYNDPYELITPTRSGSVIPDVIIKDNDGILDAVVIDLHGGLLSIDKTYERIYASIKEGITNIPDDDCKLIIEQVERVRMILDAISMRSKMLSKVANFLILEQKNYILNGPAHLKPLRQKDIAAGIGHHESTICRALANKYCRLPNGEVIKFDLFFDSALPIRTLMSQIISNSDKPLSDNEIAKKLSEHGIEIARRTVAKYRAQLKVLPYQLRDI